MTPKEAIYIPDWQVEPTPDKQSSSAESQCRLRPKPDRRRQDDDPAGQTESPSPMVSPALWWMAMLVSAFLGSRWVVRRLRRSRASRYDVGSVSDDWLIQQRRDR
jgi:hypothetical protein